ncbi:MAG: nucleotidyltransferase domain-containing protein, partial [Lachnospiraceae bacterium]|nr:nucleotidyltransferase domain-containing protein [Lachnospiraceae bacterium]
MFPKEYQTVIECFVRQNQSVLGENLVGVYLHGSAVMGCFNPKKSDLDFIVVVKDDLSAAVKRRYMDMVVALNGQAPAKGIELSVVRETVCRPFVYPTPFVLHFSAAHLN